MLKKIFVTLFEVALIALFIYMIITVINSISFADKYETIPWCITEYKH